MSNPKIVVAWCRETGGAFVTSTGSDPGAPEWENDGPFATPLAAVRAAREAGIPATHRITVGDTIAIAVPPEAAPARLTADDLESFKVGSVVYVASPLVAGVPYKRTRKGWQTFSQSSGRANGKPLTSEAIAERGAWTR